MNLTLFLVFCAIWKTNPLPTNDRNSVDAQLSEAPRNFGKSPQPCLKAKSETMNTRGLGETPSRTSQTTENNWNLASLSIDAIERKSGRSCAQYTVGWIAALRHERAAATAVLDEQHARPADLLPSSIDTNSYTWGRIGSHNVVIASLPAGKMGNVSAATTATNMLRSFPNIRIGLMVGIGGAIARPQKGPHFDIRLGDVVVSQPGGTSGGVVQWDFGRIEVGERFDRKGCLNEPPRVLLHALSNLQSEHEIRQSRIPDILKEMWKNNPKLEKGTQGNYGYVYQGKENDQLFEDSEEHFDNEQDCSKCAGKKKVPRNDRDSNDPWIHYGVIASGETVIKDSIKRNMILEEIGEECMCVEMEAAGLMNNFPCLVIRGISDYADSHKNYRWQRYAAATAAAYAKELLAVIPGEDVEATRKAADVMNEVNSRLDKIERYIIERRLYDHQNNILQWLSAPDPETSHRKALGLRQKGSGQWLLTGEVFKAWKAQRNSFLWLHGIMGCGKTILSSSIIESLGSTSLPVLFFYFDFTEAKKQTLENMLRSLIKQLSLQSKNWNQLNGLLEECDNGQTVVTCDQLYRALHQMLKQTPECFIVLDALDECTTRRGDSTSQGLLTWIRNVLKSDQGNVHLLATSRPEQDIESHFDDWLSRKSRIHIHTELISEDINAYVAARIKEDECLERWRDNKTVQEEIKRTLIQKSSGMFRWVACQLDALGNCLDYHSLQKALMTLPRNLEETYARILNNIPPEQKTNAIRILQLLTYSERPLWIQEVVDAVAVDIDRDPYFDPKYRMPNPLEISRYCSSLVVMVPERPYVSIGHRNKPSGTVMLQLAHVSVNEYLRSNRLPNDIAGHLQESSARAAISTICIAYLLQLDGFVGIGNKLPFSHYSARYWITHASVVESIDETVRTFIKKLFSQTGTYQLCCFLHNPRPLTQLVDTLWVCVIPPLYYASYAGLQHTTEWLLSNGAEVNAVGGFYRRALTAASAEGHQQVVKQLLNAGAEVNGSNDRGACSLTIFNPLAVAIIGGHLGVIDVLLKAGADTNTELGPDNNALCEASSRGNGKIVEKLLEAGARVGGSSSPYALYIASERGHEEVVELLLKAGADVNAKSVRSSGESALSVASRWGCCHIVKKLLQAGADIHAKHPHYGNALERAIQGGHHQVVQLLIEAGAG